MFLKIWRKNYTPIFIFASLTASTDTHHKSWCCPMLSYFCEGFWKRETGYVFSREQEPPKPRGSCVIITLRCRAARLKPSACAFPLRLTWRSQVAVKAPTPFRNNSSVPKQTHRHGASAGAGDYCAGLRNTAWPGDGTRRGGWAVMGSLIDSLFALISRRILPDTYWDVLNRNII